MFTWPLRSTEPAVRFKVWSAPPVAPTSSRPTAPEPALRVKVRPAPVTAPFMSMPPAALSRVMSWARATDLFQVCAPLVRMVEAKEPTFAEPEAPEAPTVRAPTRVVAPMVLLRLMAALPESREKAWVPAPEPLTVPLRVMAWLLVRRPAPEAAVTVMFWVLE